MKLRTEHYIAINYLALPRRGGLTVRELAELCEVNPQTLYNWQDNPVFAAELKRRMIRNSRALLPEMLDAAAKGVTEDRNAAMLKLLLQMNDMLTDPVNVSDKLDSAGDVEAMQERIKEYKERASKEKESK